MKTLLSETNGYKVFAEISEGEYNIGKMQLSFYTQYNDAKDPEALQHKFSMLLTSEEIGRLAQLVERHVYTV